jgi:hypothetical protein
MILLGLRSGRTEVKQSTGIVVDASHPRTKHNRNPPPSPEYCRGDTGA